MVVQNMNIWEKVVQNDKQIGEKVVQNMNICEEDVQNSKNDLLEVAFSHKMCNNKCK